MFTPCSKFPIATESYIRYNDSQEGNGAFAYNLADYFMGDDSMEAIMLFITNKVLPFLFELVTSVGLKLLIAALIFVVGFFLIKWIKKFIKTSPKLNKVDSGVRSFLASFSVIALYIVLFVTIAAVLGVPITSFLTVLASCGVAIGLALQGALSNFAGGILILLFKPFKVGDYIEASGGEGVVQEITVVYTVLLTADNKRITIPNGTLTNAVVKNYSAEETRRVDLTFNTACSCDMEKTREVIMDVIKANALALQDPAPFVKLSQHTDSALEFTARVWCKSADYWTVYFDMREGVERAFIASGIETPYPQMDIRVKSVEK